MLVVEDDPSLADAIATLLENSGYRPVLVADDRAALHCIQAGGIDLVLLDLDLPRPSAIELCRQIWTATRGADVRLPILLLAPRGNREALTAGYAAGADDYVPKLFHPAELLARVRVCLQLQALARLVSGPVASVAKQRPIDGHRTDAAIPPGRRVPPVPDRQALLPDLTEPLTAREWAVLALFARRFTNKEIAAIINVSWQTVAKHANNIYQKLRVTSRRDAVDRARALGILPSASDCADGR